jgi:hypothetical protein
MGQMLWGGRLRGWAFGCACLAAGVAQAATPERACKLTGTFPVPARVALDFVVKPKTRELCHQGRCVPLAHDSQGKLAYRCRMATDSYCVGSNQLSSAGPFVYEEDLTIDLTRGTFEGTMKGSVGDIGPQPFDVQVLGVCAPVAH